MFSVGLLVKIITPYFFLCLVRINCVNLWLKLLSSFGFSDNKICLKRNRKAVDEKAEQVSEMKIKKAPVGLAIFALVGPSMVWAAEYIGSGEVVIATRTGAVLGTTILWAAVIGIFLKFWIGMSGARYTVCTGEGMIDMFERIPGPRHWVVWLVLVVQFVCAILSIGTLGTAAGVFIHSLIPCIDVKICGWFAVFFAVAVVWSGVFNVLKMVMSLFVFIVVLGALYIAAHVLPGFSELMRGLTFSLPTVPSWAAAIEGVSENPWDEILPLLGWGAGGFASQVWYTYWVLGAGYGAAAEDLRRLYFVRTSSIGNFSYRNPDGARDDYRVAGACFFVADNSGDSCERSCAGGLGRENQPGSRGVRNDGG